MRKEAQEIVPSLYLGAINAALNADKLVAAGITHLSVLPSFVSLNEAPD